VNGALGQTMRSNVVRGISDPNENQPCVAELLFRNSQGTALAQKRVLLAPGTADFLDLNMNTQVSRLGERVPITPSLRPATSGSAIGCVVSLQLFDQLTGWTTTYISDTSL
jgi:hypothetical protein